MIMSLCACASNIQWWMDLDFENCENLCAKSALSSQFVMICGRTATFLRSQIGSLLLFKTKVNWWLFFATFLIFPNSLQKCYYKVTFEFSNWHDGLLKTEWIVNLTQHQNFNQVNFFDWHCFHPLYAVLYQRNFVPYHPSSLVLLCRVP